MNFQTFLDEAQRVKDIKPTADTPQKAALREPGDVGKVDRLTQVDKDKKGPAVRPVPGVTGGVRLKKRNVGSAGQYVDRIADETGQKRQAPSEEEITYQSFGRSKGGAPKRIQRKYKPSRDRIVKADKDFDSALETAYEPTAREGLNIPRADGKGNIEVPDSGYLRHAYQASGLGINRELGSDDLKQIYDGTIDPDKADSPTGLMDKTGTETLGVRTPTARDLETHSSDAEKTGVDRDERAYLTPEVRAQQEKMRTALDDQDSKAVQDLAFQHDVTDEILDEYIGKFGRPEYKSGKTGKWKLLASLEGRGLSGDAKRMAAAYGGDLGKDGEKYKNEDGTYNFTKMKSGNKELYDTANDNRNREMVRTYLRQGGRDAYANHEGIRSILDMDLEHIRSLTVGGGDGPENWVWASGELNKLRGNRDLVGAVKKYVGDEGDTDRLKTKDIVPGQVTPAEAPRGKTLKQFLSNPSDKKRFEDDFGGMIGPTAKGTTGAFEPQNYDALSRDDVQGMRDKFIKNYGASPEQAETIFPNPGRLANRPFAVDRKGYEGDVTTTERDSVMYKKMITSLKDIYGKKTEDKLLATPEGQEGMRQLRALTGMGPGEQKAPKKPARKRRARL